MVGHALPFATPSPPASASAHLFVLCTGDVNGDGMVDVQDFLALLQAWGTVGGFGPADSDCDGTVGTLDFLSQLASWGLCPNVTGTQPLSLRDEFLAADLTSSNYDAFVNNVADPNYRCWTAHYLTTCSPTCAQPPTCPSGDPYRTGRH